MAFTDWIRRRAWQMTTRAVGFPPEWHDKVLNRIAAGASGGGTECSALTASVRILSAVISTAPLGVYAKLGPDAFELAESHSIHKLISLAPNPTTTSAEWRRQMVGRMLRTKGSFDQILLNSKDEVLGLIPLAPDKVEIVDSGMEQAFKVTKKDGSVVTLPSREVLYIPYLFDGLSLGEHANKAAQLAASADAFAQRFFSSGGLQQLALETDQVVQPDKKREIVEQLHKNLLDGKVPFTDAGTKLKALNVKFEEVQLKDTRTFQAREVARIIGVQPHLIGDLERSTNNNIEQQSIEFVNFTVHPLVTAIEQRLDMSLFGPREGGRYCARFDLSGLTQADWESTADGSSRMVTAGIMTPNEGRRRIGLNPHPLGDKLYIQGAMMPIDKVGQMEAPNGTGTA